MFITGEFCKKDDKACSKKTLLRERGSRSLMDALNKTYLHKLCPDD